MKLKLNGITALLLLCSTLTKAQNLAPLKEITPTSPEASALSKAISYPVNLNSGLPDISIPLYTLESGDLKLPIGLSYHSGGFKISEQSTSVGLGWSLSSDIQITRSVNGLDDFQPEVGYLANSLVTTHYDNGNCPGCTYPLTGGAYFGANAIALAMGKVDGMPDKFNYKLLHKSGSFYFAKSNNGVGYFILPVPYDNIRITYDNGKFTITDTDGTVYTFGSTLPVNPVNAAAQGFEVTGEGYVDGTGVHYDYKELNPYRITAWKCMSIANATQTATINFTYQAKSVTIGAKPVEKVDYYNNDNPCNLGSGINGLNLNNEVPSGITTYSDLLLHYSFYGLSSPRYFTVSGLTTVFHLPYMVKNSSGVYQTTPVDRTFAVQYNAPGAMGEYQTGASSSLISGLAVSTISFKGGTAVFNGTDKLNSIIVKNSSNDQVKSILFNSTYTANNSSSPSYAKAMNGDSFQGTLYLDSVRIAGTGLSGETYAFLYNSKMCFGNHLSGSDAWGYWNSNTRGGDVNAGINVPHKAITQPFYLDTYNTCTNVLNNIIFNIGGNDTELPFETSRNGILTTIVYPTGGYTVFDFEPNLYKIEGVLSDYSGSYPLVQRAGGLRVRSISNYDGKTSKLQNQKYYRYGELEDGIGILMNKPPRDLSANQTPITGVFTGYSYAQDMIYYKNPNSPTANNKSSLTAWLKETKTTYLAASSLDYSYTNGSPIYYTKVTEYNSDLGVQTGKRVYNYFPPPPGNQPSLLTGTNLPLLYADREIGQEQSILDYKFENGAYKLFHRKDFTYKTFKYTPQVKVASAYLKNIYLPTPGGGPIASNIDMYNGSFGGVGVNINADYTANQYGISSEKQLIETENETWMTDSRILTQNTSYAYNWLDSYYYLNPDVITTTNTKGEQITKTFKYAYSMAGSSTFSQMISSNMISAPVDVILANTSTGKELSHTLTNFSTAGAINGSTGFIAPVSVQTSTQGRPLETQETFLYNEKGNVIQVTYKNGLVKSYLWGYNYQYPIAEFAGVNYTTAMGATDAGSFQTITDDTQMRTALAVLRNNPAAMVSTFTYKPLVGVTSQTAPNGLDKFYDYDDFGRLLTIKDQNQNIVNRYAYKYRPINYNYYTNFFGYPNVPVTATFVRPSSTTPTTYNAYNYTVPGGITTYNPASVANDNAENTAYSYGPGPPMSPTPGDPASSFAIINTSSFMYNGFATANNIWVDFFQDNSIVASSRFPITTNGTVDGPQNICYVKGGVYIVGFRQSAVEGAAMLKYHVFGSDGSSIVLKSGDSFTLTGGVTYKIQVSNCI